MGLLGVGFWFLCLLFGSFQSVVFFVHPQGYDGLCFIILFILLSHSYLLEACSPLMKDRIKADPDWVGVELGRVEEGELWPGYIAWAKKSTFWNETQLTFVNWPFPGMRDCSVISLLEVAIDANGLRVFFSMCLLLGISCATVHTKIRNNLWESVLSFQYTIWAPEVQLGLSDSQNLKVRPYC